jgi:hypothetical protein
VTHLAALSSTGWGFRQTPAHVFRGMPAPSPTKFVPTARETRRVNLCLHSLGIFRIYEGITFPAIFNPVSLTPKMNRKPGPKNSESYSHGHEHTIDHPRRDIFVRRVWLLWARALVLSGRHGTNSPSCCRASARRSLPWEYMSFGNLLSSPATCFAKWLSIGLPFGRAISFFD